MPRGMPCQNSMEQSPATLKMSEKVMKYHFLPRKSILGLRKNSTRIKPFFVHVGRMPSPALPGGAGRLSPFAMGNVELCSTGRARAPVPHGRSKYLMLLQFAYGSTPNQKLLTRQKPRRTG